jgi:hypothetical protein
VRAVIGAVRTCVLGCAPLAVVEPSVVEPPVTAGFVGAAEVDVEVDVEVEETEVDEAELAEVPPETLAVP